MRKNLLLCLSALLLTIGWSSCSKDDEVDNRLTTLDGTWNLVKASYGLVGIQEYQAGEVTITFNNKYKRIVVKNDKGIDFLKSGVYPYKIETEQRRILTYEWVDVEYQVIVINYTDEVWGDREVRYIYDFSDGMLVLDGDMAADGPGYYFTR